MTSARKWRSACRCFAALPITIGICVDTRADDTTPTNSPPAIVTEPGDIIQGTPLRDYQVFDTITQTAGQDRGAHESWK